MTGIHRDIWLQIFLCRNFTSNDRKPHFFQSYKKIHLNISCLNFINLIQSTESGLRGKEGSVIKGSACSCENLNQIPRIQMKKPAQQCKSALLPSATRWEKATEGSLETQGSTKSFFTVRLQAREGSCLKGMVEGACRLMLLTSSHTCKCSPSYEDVHTK